MSWPIIFWVFSVGSWNHLILIFASFHAVKISNIIQVLVVFAADPWRSKISVEVCFLFSANFTLWFSFLFGFNSKRKKSNWRKDLMKLNTNRVMHNLLTKNKINVWKRFNEIATIYFFLSTANVAIKFITFSKPLKPSNFFFFVSYQRT